MKRLKRVVEGSTDTMLSASRANELIDAINALLNMRPGKGIKISKADSGFVIELTDALQEGLALKGDGEGGEGVEGGQAPGALRWRGEWDSTVAAVGGYSKNDIVIHRSDAAIDSGTKAGTYIAIADKPLIEPFEDEIEEQTQWRTFAKGSWGKLRIGSVDNPGSIFLDEDHCFGRLVRVREIDVCDGGISRKMLVLASEIYD